MTKKCRECQQDKPLDQYHRHKATRDRLRAECKACGNKSSLKWQKEHPESRRKTYDHWARNNRDKLRVNHRRKNLRKTYGITEGEYNELLQDAGGVCSICKRLESSMINGKIKNMSIDHCHSTGIIRGILCARCNTAIGKFGDSIELLKSAIEYLGKFKSSDEA